MLDGKNILVVEDDLDIRELILFNLKNDPDEMKNLSGLKEYSKIETKLNEKILKDWKPQKIKETIESKINSKKILKAWAQSVQPSDKYKWETKAEDNWLE